jgi:hypothetical protein
LVTWEKMIALIMQNNIVSLYFIGNMYFINVLN